MIVFEEKLRELIALMPSNINANGEFPIRYDWGTIDVLNKFLILKENVSKYPLIWLVTSKDTDDLLRNRVTRNARLVIATRSNDVDGFNKKQYQTDYTNILIPVYNDFITLLNSSGVSKIVNSKVEKELKPNYSINDNGKGLVTIWNAIVLDLEIELTNNCINKDIKWLKR
jgi:hypothetical protein